jgi:hypothetical protein
MYRTHWLAAVFLFVLASAASAAVKPYQEFASASGCTYQGDCAIVFPAVTAQTLILRASCAFSLQNGASISFASLGTQNDNPRDELQFIVYASSNSATSYGINAETYLFVATGDQPRIDVFSLGAPVVDLICTVTGNVN